MKQSGLSANQLRFNKGLLAASVALLCAGGVEATAQEQDQVKSRLGLMEEVTVTARFREESAQDIGASIGAFSGEQLERSGIVDFEDIARGMAGVEILDQGANRNDITIRGVANAARSNTSGGSQPLISVYVDDISIASPGSAFQRDVNLFDFDRVEVLRGPQPTLFGEGSVGGTIRYFSADPSLDGEFDGKFSSNITFTEDGGTNYRIENATSFTLVPDKVGLRLVASYRDDDGFIDNEALGLEDINTLESTTIRGVLLAQLSDNLEMRLTANVGQDDVGEFNDIDANVSLDDIDEDDLVTSPANLLDGDIEDDYELYSLKFSWDVSDTLTVESITGYYTRETSAESFAAAVTNGFRGFFGRIPSIGFSPPLPAPVSFMPSNLFAPDGSLIVNTTVTSEVTTEEETFSQEFRFISNLDGPLNYTAGLYFQDGEADSDSNFPGHPDFLTISAPATQTINRTTNNVEAEQFSGFVEFTFDLSDSFRLIAGARYVKETLTHTTLESSGLTISALVPALLGNFPDLTAPVFLPFTDFVDELNAPGNPGSTFEFELEEILPRVGFEFDLAQDVLLYGAAARGLRNGGVNMPGSARNLGAPGTPEFFDALTYDEDEATSYELGLKSELLNGDMTLNAAIYFTDFESQQITIGVPSTLTTNAPDQDIMGLELETVFFVNDNLSLTFSGSVTDAEYTDGLATLAINGAPVGFEDLAEGNSPPGVPDFSFSVATDFYFPGVVRDWDFIGQVAFQYIDERYSTPQNFPSTKLGALELLNLRAGLANENWSITAFVNNALNDLEAVNAVVPTNLAAIDENGIVDSLLSNVQVNRPLTAGFTVSFNY